MDADKTQILHRALSNIFGSGWEHALIPTLASSSALAEVLYYVNTLALTAISVIMLASWMLGIGHAAGEGKIGGGVHSVYTPLRIATASTLCMPIPWLKGLCLAQGAILMLMALGIGFANKTLGVAVDFMAEHAGATMPAPQFATKLMPAATGISQTATLYYYLQTDNPGSKGISEGPTWHQNPKQNTLQQLGDGVSYVATRAAKLFTGGGINKTTPDMRDGGYYAYDFYIKTSHQAQNDQPATFVGGLKVPCQDATSKICVARVNATTKLVQSIFLSRCSEAIALAGDIKRASMCQSGGELPAEAMADYVEKMQEVSVKMAESQVGGLKSHLKEQASMMKQLGFVMLGSWYWTMVHAQEVHDAASDVYPEYVEPDKDAVLAITYGKDSLARAVANSLDEAAHEFSPGQMRRRIADTARVADGRSSASGETGEKINKLDQVLSKITDLVSAPVRLGVEGMVAFTATGDPILHLSRIGHTMISGTEALVMGYFALRTVSGAANGWSKNSLWGKAAALFTGGATSAVAGAAKSALTTMGPMIWGASFGLLMLGASLAYYLPAIPWLIWTMSIIGYLLIAFEMFVLAPFWACTYAFPGGQGFAHQRTTAGNMIILDLLFRPLIMTVAFFVSFYLIKIIGLLVSFGFVAIFEALTQGQIVGIVGGITMLTILTGFLVWCSHTVFGITHTWPDGFQKIIGGHQGVASHTARDGHSFVAGVVKTGSADGKAHLGALPRPRGEAGRGTAGLGGPKVASASEDKTNAAATGNEGSGKV